MAVPSSPTSWHFVEALMQPTDAACFPTALRILDRARRGRMGLGFGLESGGLSAIFQSKQGIKQIRLVTQADADKMAERLGFSYKYLKVVPEAIFDVLRSTGPFCL